MKKSGKKLLAGAAALAMSCSMVTGWANGATIPNKVTITGVKVLSDPVGGTGEPTVSATYDEAQIKTGAVKLSTAQMLQVTVKLTAGAAENPAAAVGDVTFLSNINGETTLDNGTIQYVDQQTASTTDGTATITFRPRTTVNSTAANANNIVTAGLGTFVAKAGGTDVSETASFNYTVEAPKKDMTVSSDSVTIKSGESAVFTVPADMTNVVVKEGSTALDSSAVSYSGTTLTISGLGVGSHSLVISADGYNDKNVTVLVESSDVSDVDVKDVTDNLNKGLDNITQGGASVELPSSAKGASDESSYSVTYSIPEASPNKDKVTLTNNTLALNTGVFAAKVNVKATVGQIETSKDIYLVASNTNQIAFGNVELISTSTGEDAFLDDEKFGSVTVDTPTKTAIQTEVLNFALDRRTPSELGDVLKSAVDYDLNGDVTLSEYRMLKLMLENTPNFTPTDMAGERTTWINKAKGTVE